ncbi:hypothetical protein [Sphaerisporangium dianthi]|uniref:F-box domain-containing protein n=1 Tax=Sphaerisporangium dianthi TaxID=1436120 RepID=A0ABV9CBB4_9ACTN
MGKDKKKSRGKSRKKGVKHSGSDGGSSSDEVKRKAVSSDEEDGTGSPMAQSEGEEVRSDESEYEMDDSDYERFVRRSPQRDAPSTVRSSGADDVDQPALSTGGVLVRTKQDQVARPRTDQPAVPASQAPGLAALLGTFSLDIAVHLLEFLSFSDLQTLRRVDQSTKRFVDGIPGWWAGDKLRRGAPVPTLLGFWLRAVRGVVPGISPQYVLAVAREMPEPRDPALWRELGAVLQVSFTTMPEIVGQLAWQRGEGDDDAIVQDLRELAAVIGLDTDQVLTRYEEVAFTPNPLTLIRGTAPGTGRPPSGYLKSRDEEKITLAVRAKLTALHGKLEGAVQAAGKLEFRKDLLAKTGSGQRALDRLAWVVQHLQDSRECIAVASAGNELRLWANNPDADMVGHLDSLLAAASAQTQEADAELQNLLDGIWALLRTSSLDKRKTTPTLADWRMAERRLLKTVRFLGELQGRWGEIQTSAHTARYEIDKVHAETKFGDALLHLRNRLRETRDSLDGPEREVYEEKLRRLDQVRIAVGISKLCCLKCWLALRAIAAAEGTPITITGTHFRTYGWGMPLSLATAPDVLRAYLGLPDEAVTADDEALLAAINDPVRRTAVVKAINNFVTAGALTPNGYVSSGDETGLRLTRFGGPVSDGERSDAEEAVQPAKRQKLAADASSADETPADEEEDETPADEEEDDVLPPSPEGPFSDDDSGSDFEMDLQPVSAPGPRVTRPRRR